MTDTDVWKHVRGLEPFSLCDWPGRPSAVVFLGGCNLRCPTCHNFELAWNMELLPEIPAARLRGFFRERAKWLDGIVVTGGEPTCVPGIGEILWELGKFGLPIKVDSNGMRPEMIHHILSMDLAATFAVDVKGPYEKYPELTGNAVSAVVARRNLEQVFAMASAMPDRFYFRLTRVPALNTIDVDTARGYLPAGFGLTVQDFVAPRRSNAHADHEARRPVGDLVH